MKRFLSVWLAMFAIDRLREASRRRRHGRWLCAVPDDRPFALISSGARGLTIAAVNTRACAEGIAIGQTLADARAAIPDLLTGSAEPERDRARLIAFAHAMGRYGPARNVEGADGLWVDITGAAHLFGGEDALGEDVIRRFARAGYRARVAIADTPAAAFALARYAEERAVCAGHTAEALAPLPVEALRLDAQTVVLLKRLGLRRIGQLYELPRVVLARRFRDLRHKGAGNAAAREGLAQAVVMRLDQALGVVADPRVPLTEPPAYIVRRAYPEMLITSEGIESACRELAAELCTNLAAVQKGALRLRYALYRADGSVGNAMIGTSRPCRAPAHLLELFRDRLANLDVGFGVDMITLEALQVDALDETQAHFAPSGRGDPGDEAGNAAALVDRLVNRLGRHAVFRLEGIASHVPERAQQRITEQRITDISATAPLPHEMARGRPPFLLSPPEPITVMAEVPEGPPARFTWRRVAHRIVKAEGPERIGPEWWRWLGHADRVNSGPHRLPGTTQAAGSGEADVAAGSQERGEDAASGRGGEASNAFVQERAARQPNLTAREMMHMRIRDYYHLEDDRGARYWVFRAGLYQREREDGAPSWYMHGLFG